MPINGFRRYPEFCQKKMPYWPAYIVDKMLFCRRYIHLTQQGHLHPLLWHAITQFVVDAAGIYRCILSKHITMTSSNGSMFRVTGSLWGLPMDSPHSDAELWCFLGCAPEQKTEQTVDISVIWDARALIVTSLWWLHTVYPNKYAHGFVVLCFVVVI